MSGEITKITDYQHCLFGFFRGLVRGHREKVPNYLQYTLGEELEAELDNLSLKQEKERLLEAHVANKMNSAMRRARSAPFDFFVARLVYHHARPRLYWTADGLNLWLFLFHDRSLRNLSQESEAGQDLSVFSQPLEIDDRLVFLDNDAYQQISADDLRKILHRSPTPEIASYHLCAALRNQPSTILICDVHELVAPNASDELPPLVAEEQPSLSQQAEHWKREIFYIDEMIAQLNEQIATGRCAGLSYSQLEQKHKQLHELQAELLKRQFWMAKAVCEESDVNSSRAREAAAIMRSCGAAYQRLTAC